MADKSDFMVTARKRFAAAAEYSRRQREEARQDWRFYAGDQWTEELRRDRENAGRPCITVNRCGTFAKQVINQIRSARPQGQVHPVSDADEADAEVRQGMTRHIEVDSDAELGYDCAITAAVVGGFGAWRIISDYEDEKSFDQCLKVARILDPFSVYWDPNAQEPDRSDAQWCFVRERVSLEAYEAEYGEAVAAANFADIDDAQAWIEGDYVYVADYYYITSESTTLVKYVGKDGQTKEDVFADVPEKVKVIGKRETTIKTVNWCKVNGLKKLEEYEWRGKWIPVVPAFGDEFVIDGETHLVGLMRYMRDPQRMFNYIKSGITERVGLATAAKWLVAAGQTKGRELMWENANRPGSPTLEWTPILAENGTLLPPPMPIVQESGIADLTAELLQTDQDLKTSSGLFDPSLGNGRTDQSGKAIQALQSQGNITNYAFGDNLSRSIRHSTRILLDLIPHYYDAGRVLTIEGMDGQKQTVYVYNSDTNPNPETKAAVRGLYDLKKGKYAVTVSTGPSFETQRQQDVDFWLGLVKSFPELMQIAGDIIVGRMDSPEARAVSERLKAVLPAPIQQMMQSGQPPSPQAMQAQQQNQQLHGIVQQLVQERQAKLLDVQAKVQMNARDNETRLVVADIAAKADTSQALLQQQIDQLNAILGVQSQQENNAHEAAMQQMDHRHDAVKLLATQQNQQQLAASQQEHQQGLQSDAQDFQAKQAEQAQEMGVDQ